MVIEAKHYMTGFPIRLEIGEGIIEKITEIPDSESGNSLFIAPGFTDNQVNGCGGIDFAQKDLSCSELERAASILLKEGVTTFLPTLITDSHLNLVRSLGNISSAMDESELLRYMIPGIHLEGPFISPEDGFRGCHPAKHVRMPSVEELKRLVSASRNRIIQLTLAPELEGAMELINYCSKNGIVVAIGHSNATAAQIKLAVDKGATISTHLGNGCANMIHRHFNPLWQQLSDERLTPSVIADGLHLLREEIDVMFKVKGRDNMILTSDMVFLAGMPEGSYSYLGTEVLITENGSLIDKHHNCLAGASFPIKRGIENILNFTACSLGDAINMASGNVCRIYGLTDRGTLSTGKRADLLLFEIEGNVLKIRDIILNGESI